MKVLDKNGLKANLLHLQLPLGQATTTDSTPLRYLEAIGLTHHSHASCVLPFPSHAVLSFEVCHCESLSSTSLSLHCIL